jgi:hypothetical protein
MGIGPREAQLGVLNGKTKRFDDLNLDDKKLRTVSSDLNEGRLPVQLH